MILLEEKKKDNDKYYEEDIIHVYETPEKLERDAPDIRHRSAFSPTLGAEDTSVESQPRLPLLSARWCLMCGNWRSSKNIGCIWVTQNIILPEYIAVPDPANEPAGTAKAVLFVTYKLSTYAKYRYHGPSSLKPTITSSREERINRAAAAIDVFLQNDPFFTTDPTKNSLGETTWPYGELLTQMANFDILTNQTRYKDEAQLRYLPAFQGLKPKQTRYGYAAFRAYLAYQDATFLAIARNFWNVSHPLMLTEQEVASGKSAVKTKIAISRNCSEIPGVTLAGGTLHNSDDKGPMITLSSTADYLALSVSLATDDPSNQTYMNTARELAQFILTVLYRGDGQFFDYVNAQDGRDCERGRTHNIASEAASGVLGLSLLGLATKNQSLLDSYLRSISAIGTTVGMEGGGHGPWHSQEGVLIAPNIDVPGNPGTFTQHLLQSYFELAIGSDTPSDLKAYLQKYIGVQYNAVVDQAASQLDANIYGSSLQGPSGTRFNVTSQMVAITALLGGLSLSVNDSPRSPKPSDRNGTPIGVVIGGTTGGVVGILLAVLLGYLYICRRRRIRRQTTHSERIVRPYSPVMDVHAMTPIKRTRGKLFTEKGSSVESASTSPPTESRPAGFQALSSVNDAGQLAPFNEASTAHLVMILNDRLQNERWDMNEEPPDYSSRRGG
ncbi:hypothetical protein V5O48_004781 [Marasmius crinis-equi]|uniref:Uncharacterized protein n=1 Tax=Marasmius crinis-equi TaxID=585013 RepID=A0ABR3FP83_9AGAR